MCNCGSNSAANVSGTSTSLSSFSASSGGYIVYKPDGSTKTVSSEAEARMAVAASGGTYRKA